MTGSLAALLDQATPGPWEPICDPDDEERAWVLAISEGARTYVVQQPYLHDMGMLDADARLIALAPDLARLLIDMAASLDYGYFDRTTDTWRCAMCDAPEGHAEGCSHGEMLARFAALDEKAGAA